MQFPDGKKEESLKTTTNYPISKAHEMKEFLPWAESFQSHVITPQHVRAVAAAGICSDMEPEKLSRDMGLLQHVLHGLREGSLRQC